MAAPVVQNLEQILAELEPAYATQRNLYGTQQGGLEQKYAGQIQGLTTKKENSFRDINRGANSRGMAFSGAPVEEQMRYVGEQFLPGMTNLQNQQNQEGMQLQMAIAQLDSEKRLRGLDTRSGQEKAFQQWQEAEQQRQFQERMQREQLAAQAAEAARSRAAASAANAPGPAPADSLLSFMSGQFKGAGGQGNKNITRQQQDAWVNQWFLNNGIMGAGARQGFWDLVNSTYKRTAKAQDDWRYKR